MGIPPVFRKITVRRSSCDVGKGKGLISKWILLRLNNQRKKWKVLCLSLPPRASPNLTLLPGKIWKTLYCTRETDKPFIAQETWDPFIAQVPHPNEKPRNQKRKRHFLPIFLSSRENRCRYFLAGKFRVLWRHQLFHSHLSLTWPVCFTAPRQCHHHSRESRMMSMSSSCLGD